MTEEFPPTRAAALERLAGFVPKAGRAYAAGRNHDLPHEGHPHVSRLSPYIRHRLVTEGEVLDAVLARFAPSSAEKFIQEVYWRTYWKGWLEMRPAVWDGYRDGVRHGLDRIATEGGLRRDWEAACRGETGIECFDHWAQDLAGTGYLHNHARMWFASIWIFTLRLPWELGADFFLRHLLDGDPASNTLGWRWVGGLQTRGKTYLARASNIARYTEGRFNPEGQLATDAPPLDGPDHPPRMAPPAGDRLAPGLATGWLVTEDDLSPGFALPREGIAGPAALVSCAGLRSPLAVAAPVTGFTEAAGDDMAARYGDRFDGIARPGGDSAEAIADAVTDWAGGRGLAQVAMPWAPTGPGGDMIRALGPKLAERDIRLVRVLRPFDAEAWPYATAGFFKFREKIPKLLGARRGLRAA